MIIKENVYQRELKIQRRFTQDYCNTGGRMNFIGIKKKTKKKTGVVSNMGWASRLALENAGRVGGQSNQAMHVCYLAWLKLPPSHRDWEIGLYLFWWFHLKNQLPGLWESHSWVVKLAKEARWRIMSSRGRGKIRNEKFTSVTILGKGSGESQVRKQTV